METRLIGKVVSRRFRVEDVIGRGGMAIVYRAFDLKTQQTVAFKVLREEYEDDPEYKARFRREAEVCRKLNHPNIVNLIDAGETSGISYIALEYVDGPTLKERIAEEGRLTQEEAVHCALQILAALAHAHQRGIIHRDIKPQNIMVSRTGQLKVGDFGIAGIADSQTLAADGNVLGSVHYFSPEQAKGMKASGASDLYSVGVILYEMLAGHVPFDGETALSVAMMHLMQTPKPIEGEADVSQAVALIVKKALQKRPEDRYQSADAMIRDLRRALRHPDGAFMQARRASWSGQERAQSRRRARRRGGLAGKLGAVFVALMLCVLLMVAGIRMYRAMFVVVRVPALSGLDAVTAQRLVEGAGLSMSVDYAYSDTPEGCVAAQRPAQGSELARGSVVNVTLSQGTGLITMQRLIGLTQQEAVESLLAQGLVVGDVRVVPSEMMRGTVIAQSPVAGQSAAIGSRVNLQISGGRVIVPELAGQREEEARARLEDVGLSCGMVTYQVVESARQDGVVLAQSLAKFDEVLPGSVVEMTVGVYDKRRYTADVSLTIPVPEEGVAVRVTLVDADGTENDMYAAMHSEPGEARIDVELRSETSGVMTWRLYLDGNFKSEATALLQ